MSDDAAYTMEVRGLDQLLKALKARPPVARVGILGSNPREGGGPTNADIGAAHEFGTTTIPQRSFLRMPISEGLQGEMESSGALDKDVLANVIKSGSVVPWLKKVSKLALNLVFDAFDTEGNGKWPAWKIPGYTNNTGQLLLDTQQLRNSITDEVKE